MPDLMRYRFGVNYTPSKNWWYCWNDFDADSIARDLDAVASLDVDHIRVMVMWTYFQPDPRWVSPAHLERLGRLMTLAGQRGLDVCVSMLNGHLTGQNFRQGYEKGRPFYTDPQLRHSQELFLHAVADTLQGHRNLMGLDLGNEISCCWQTENPAEGDAWMDDMLTLADELLPAGTHVNGVDHNPWFGSNRTFSPQALARRQRLATLHSWIYFTGALEHGGPFGDASIHLAAAMAALARSYAGDPAKPIWVQEYGASEEWMPAEKIPDFCTKATTSAIRAGVSWITWWASHDIDRKFQVDPLEYSLGLFDVNNRLKPQGNAFAEIVAAYRGKGVSLDAFNRVPLPPPPAALNPKATWDWLLAWIEQWKGIRE